MKQTIKLGNKDYEYNVNFKLNYDFLKYRNQITTGFDITKANKKVIEEIITMQNKVQNYEDKLKSEGKEVTDMTGLEFIDELSPEAKEFLSNDNSNNILKSLTDEDIIDIVSKFTGITNKDEIYNILDIEIEDIGYDKLIQKLINAINEVFTIAKSSSQQKEMNKQELVEVAKK